MCERFCQIPTCADLSGFRNQSGQGFPVFHQHKALFLIMNRADTIREVSGGVRHGDGYLFRIIRLSDFWQRGKRQSTAGAGAWGHSKKRGLIRNLSADCRRFLKQMFICRSRAGAAGCGDFGYLVLLTGQLAGGSKRQQAEAVQSVAHHGGTGSRSRVLRPGALR